MGKKQTAGQNHNAGSKQKSQKKKQKQEDSLSHGGNTMIGESSFPSELLSHKRPKDAPCSCSCGGTTLLPGFIWTVQGLLTPTECKAWIDYVETNQKWSLTTQRATRYMAHRECYRYQQHDPVMAARLLERMKSDHDTTAASSATNLLETIATQAHSLQNHQRPMGCNPNLRLYKYTRGMSFGRHVDESQDLSCGGHTRVTVLIYLSECQGGATRFHTLRQGHANQEDEIAVVPRQGLALLHIHGNDCLLHEADPVLDGIKYVLRTDLVYSTPG